MKKLCIFLVLALLVIVSSSFAEGFLPSTDKLFGQMMPSLSSVLDREADSKIETEDGIVYSYKDITENEYTDFSSYIGGTGCVVDSATIENGILTATISRGDSAIVFTYDKSESTASILYLNGTRPEDTKQKSSKASLALPEYIRAFGTGMPSMNPIVNNSPKTQSNDDGGMRITYSEVSEANYDAFSRYLNTRNCIMTDFQVNGNDATVMLSFKGTSFKFQFNAENHTATISYPSLCFVEDDIFTDSKTIEALFPLSDETFGILMPRIALGTNLKSTGITVLEDGSWEESYPGFSDEEYAEFSTYLKEKNCTVIDYEVDTSGVMTIQLEEKGVPFTLIYDRARALATVHYAANSRPEPTPSPTPSPSPTPLPTPEPTKEVAIRYSESECWNTAKVYFDSRRWNNPDSVKIYEYTWTLDLTSGIYTFRIDYSAENELGGSVRKYGFVMVDAGENIVTNAWLD